MSPRCAWTNEEAEDLKEVVLVVPNRVGTDPRPKTFYVLPQYETELRRFIDYTRRFALVFVFTILGLSIALPIVPLAFKASARLASNAIDSDLAFRCLPGLSN